MNIKTIHQIALQNRDLEQAYLNCGAINRSISLALSEADIENEFIEGSVTKYELRGEGPEHAFVLITDSRVTVEDQPIIVDGAIEQFCDERKSDGEVFLSFGAKSKLPKIGVFEPGDDMYSVYIF